MQIHDDIDVTKDVDHIMLSSSHAFPGVTDRLWRDNISFTIIDR
jgi:hypothetical protein